MLSRGCNRQLELWSMIQKPGSKMEMIRMGRNIPKRDALEIKKNMWDWRSLHHIWELQQSAGWTVVCLALAFRKYGQLYYFLKPRSQLSHWFRLRLLKTVLLPSAMYEQCLKIHYQGREGKVRQTNQVAASETKGRSTNNNLPLMISGKCES